MLVLRSGWGLDGSWFRGLMMGALAVSVAACSTEPATEEPVDESDVVGATPKVCAAVRGNGELIGAHFQSLARVVETYGRIQGLAGGSSGSITTFLYESMLMNPEIARCSSGRCVKGDSARLSLALKSLYGYGLVAASSEEATAVRNAAEVIARVKTQAEQQGALASVSAANAQDLRTKLEAVLSVPEFKELINPEIFEFLQGPGDLAFKVAEVQTSIKTLGAFSVDQNRLFFRTGLLNWTTLATLFGRVGDFYAGYTSTTGQFSAWLDACADASLGKPWDEAAALPGPNGGTCGEAFSKMVVAHRQKAREANAPPRRLTERVGKGPLRKLVSTSVLEGAAVGQYESALVDYRAGKYPTGAIASFKPAFADIKFGYWGADADVGAVLKNGSGFPDAKSAKASSLGADATWFDVLRASPAEPGLSRLVRLGDGRYSAGGWSDLAPVLALKNLGCGQVVYVTRQGDESVFAAKIAVQLGLDEDAWKRLYDLGNPESGFALSVAKADGVWCTNWNAFGATQQAELAKDAYFAPLEDRGLPRALRAYSGRRSSALGLPGCSVGVAGPTRWTNVITP